MNDFKKTFAKIFSSITSLDSIIINSSPRFHTCLECAVQFSSISRLLAHVQKNCNKIFTCKHCEQEFDSNNKLHEHVRLNHSRTSAKTLRQRFVEEENKHINLSVTSVSVTTLANSSVISSTQSTTSRSMSTSAMSSDLFISMRQAQAACHSTSSLNTSNTSTNLAASAALAIGSELASDHKPLATSDSKALLMRSGSDYSITSSITFRSTTAISEPSHHQITMMKASVVCSLTSPSTSSQTLMISHQKSLKSYMTMKNLFTMFAKEKRSRKSLNYIQKRMRSSMSDQTQITSYFKSVDQSNSTSINSFKSSSFISCSCLCSTSRVSSSINQVTRTSQYQHIAIDAISNLKIQRRFKASKQEYMTDASVDHTNRDTHVERLLTIAKEFKASIKASIKSADSSKIKRLKSSSLISCFCSTSRFYSSVNQTAETSQYQRIAIDQTSNLENQSKIKMQSFRQKYLVDADVIHINSDIRVETTLTELKKYKSIKSLIKSFKSVKLFKKLKFSTRIDEFNSTLRL